ncbi:hypothetical protein B0H19DRAFT_1263495 [Mycena capillaripes]|nr:hypothetical protein B0H19DRAFT_1263495 [Mycena capillaripes]
MAAFIAAYFPVFPDNLLPVFCSCNWAKWQGISFFCIPPRWYNLSEADLIFKHCFKIPGALRPLAWRNLGPYPNVLVAAGDEYFFWNGNDDILTRYGGGFASDEAFLRHLMERGGDYIDIMGSQEELTRYEESLFKAENQQRKLLLRFRPLKPLPLSEAWH